MKLDFYFFKTTKEKSLYIHDNEYINAKKFLTIYAPSEKKLVIYQCRFKPHIYVCAITITYYPKKIDISIYSIILKRNLYMFDRIHR